MDNGVDERQARDGSAFCKHAQRVILCLQQLDGEDRFTIPKQRYIAYVEACQEIAFERSESKFCVKLGSDGFDKAIAQIGAKDLRLRETEYGNDQEEDSNSNAICRSEESSHGDTGSLTSTLTASNRPTGSEIVHFDCGTAV